MKTYMTKETFEKLLENTLRDYDYTKEDIKDIVKKLNIKIVG